MTLRSLCVGAIGALLISPALAQPMASSVGAQVFNTQIEKAAWVCDDWGRCYQTYPSYGGYYGGYGGYGAYYNRGYGGYGGGYYQRGGDWDDDDRGHRGWDGRDWHGGRWGD